MSTEVGHISGMLQGQTAEETPLTKQLNKLTNQILIIAGVSLAISIGLGLWRDQPFDTLFLTAVAFAVAAIPTGLPAVVTTILAGRDGDARQGGCHRQATAIGRDAGLDVRHQLRQDRHPDAQPDDRRPDGASSAIASPSAARATPPSARSPVLRVRARCPWRGS